MTNLTTLFATDAALNDSGLAAAERALTLAVNGTPHRDILAAMPIRPSVAVWLAARNRASGADYGLLRALPKRDAAARAKLYAVACEYFQTLQGLEGQ